MAEILIAGSTGGREHALGLALHEDGANTLTFTHGGNGGTRELGTNMSLTDNEKIADYAEISRQDLVVIGPESPLVSGLADQLRARGITTFGPGQDGAQLEASKVFTANFCSEFGIPQPEYRIADTYAQTEVYVRKSKVEDYVIKADGLAGGKGVVLPDDEEHALQTIRGMMSGDLFGDAGKKILFQRRLKAIGPEVSALFMLDGNDFTLLPLSQDHKRLLDNDQGPNTGGMGAYTPLGFEDEQLVNDLMDIGDQLTQGQLKRGMNYRGIAYVGAMMDVENENKPSVLEINVRFGDPETQVVLASLGRTGISAFELLSSAANGSLDKSVRGTYLGRNMGQAAMTVCLAAEGYPESPLKGEIIEGLNRSYDSVTVHHGGTKFDTDRQQTVTSGGRVLYVTGTGETIDDATTNVYNAIGTDGINFPRMQYRTDIAWQTRAN